MMNNFKVMVCRPGKAGEQLVKDLKEINIKSQHGPTLGINQIPFNLPDQPYDHMIFISPTAVESCVELVPELASKAGKIYAVGSGTAKHLNDAGINEVIVPETFDSEGLLNLAEFKQPAGQRILIVKGVGGRPLLETTLKNRGAVCDTLDVYNRTPIEVSQDVWDCYWEGSTLRAVTAASIETLDAFDQQRRSANNNYPDIVFVASDRIAEAAASLGYTDVINVGGAANHYFTTAIDSYIKAYTL